MATVGGSVRATVGGSVRLPKWGVWTATVRVPHGTLTLTPTFTLTFPSTGTDGGGLWRAMVWGGC